MSVLERMMRPPYRTLVVIIIMGLLAIAGYQFWTPGAIITDGRHDRAANGIWISHGWLGDDAWFNKYNKDRSRFRNDKSIGTLSARLSAHGVKYLFAHLAPSDFDGKIAGSDHAQVKRFLQGLKGKKVLPWIGGVFGENAFPQSARWRNGFSDSVVELLTKHPGFAGVHINIEPMPSGNADFLLLLEELKASLPPGKILSVAAYPPPTFWQKNLQVHWEEEYFRQVAARVDQLAVMMYDTGLRYEKLYQSLMSRWTVEVINWAGGKDVLLGIAAYDDAGVGYHSPDVENVENSLMGIHAGLMTMDIIPSNYLGVAIYSNWEMEPEEWSHLETYFNK